jgi:hypothetical protein
MAVGPATGGTLITLLGVDVLVNDETRLFQRGSDDPLAASELAVGLIGDVVGIFDDDQLVATRLRTGSRASEAIVVEFDGTIASIDGATLMIDTDGGGLATVLVTDETRVRGDLVVDAFVEIRGTLDENLAVVATSIKVDRDGDGDADDDHAEDEANENGGGAVVDLRRGVRFDPATGEELEGEAETEFRETPSGQGFQEVEVAFHGAGRNEAFFVRVTFASGAIVDFGEVRANGGGRVKVKFRTVGGGDTPSLSGLLPPDETARDVTRIEIINGDGTIVLTADF